MNNILSSLLASINPITPIVQRESETGVRPGTYSGTTNGIWNGTSAVERAVYGDAAQAYDPSGSGKIPSSAPGNIGSGSGRIPTTSFNYQNADLAKLYGMDKATAYQEALANTSHQREVQDLMAAGLNPILSANGNSGAAVFASSDLSSSGGSSGGGRGGSQKKSNIPDILGNIAGGVAMAISKNKLAGSAVQMVTSSAMDLLLSIGE